MLILTVTHCHVRTLSHILLDVLYMLKVLDGFRACIVRSSNRTTATLASSNNS
jgi:hypothetical protein